jgi:hypothetical protein
MALTMNGRTPVIRETAVLYRHAIRAGEQETLDGFA